MIEVMFDFIGDKVLVRIEGERVYFAHQQFGNQMTTIDGLKLNYSGVIKEHPDLKDKDNWREEAIKRFKEYIIKLNNETERVNYIINDLKKYGYKPLFKQRKGFRIERI